LAKRLITVGIGRIGGEKARLTPGGLLTRSKGG